MSIYTDCQAIPDYVADDCGNIENGRVRHLILKKKTATITDPSSASEWNALIASGDALVIKNVFFATESLIWGQTKGIQLASTLPITDNLQEGINFNVTVKWAEMEMPTPYTSPSTLFTV